MDTIVTWLLNQTSFPAMEVVSLAGFSAGAQFLNRYAWASHQGGGRTSAAGSGRGRDIAVRFILSDASSYLYLSPQRPLSLCRPLSSATDIDTDTDTGTDPSFSCKSFAVPEVQKENETAVEDSSSNNNREMCPAYDSWKHGIADMPASGYNYLARFSASDDAQVRKLLFMW